MAVRQTMMASDQTGVSYSPTPKEDFKVTYECMLLTEAHSHPNFLRRLNGTGIALHPNLTRWLEREIRQWIEEVLHASRPLADAGAEIRDDEGADVARSNRKKMIR